MEFTHLHVHTEFSYLDGFGSVKNYAKAAKELGFKALGCTDHGNIDGLIKFQRACQKEGITPLLGCEGYIVPDELVKTPGEKRYHITLLVKNQTGWMNLGKLLTKANIEGFYYRPRFGYKSLLEHCEGLIVLTGCSSSFIWGENQAGVKLLQQINEAIPSDLYLEVMPHFIKEQISTNQFCNMLSRKFNIPIVATNDCHYIRENDAIAQEVLLAMQSKTKWDDPKRWKFGIEGLHLRSIEEMREAFERQFFFKTALEIDCFLDWTEDVFEKCKDFSIPKQDISLPKVPGYENADPGRVIWDLAEKRLIEISNDWDTDKFNQYASRLSEEWELINHKGFSPYFLIVWELVSWCKKNGIMTGPGRGSVGGSLLAYLIGITSVDPIKYGLLFSRFIAEDRIDYPDIDLDFEDRKRHLVRQHLESLYGSNHIASLSTFMSMKARQTVRDVSRVFDLDTRIVDEFSKSIIEVPDSNGGNDRLIEDALATDIGVAFKGHATEEVCNIMTSLEGQIKGCGQHAAALIVSSEDLKSGSRGNLIIRSEEPVCNWDMEDAEYVGLMKLDALGLNTLSVLDEVKRLIEAREKTPFSFENIPLDDVNVFNMLSEGNTVGVFQLSTWTMTSHIKQIKATNIEQLADILALVRPGPLDSGMAQQYIDRKNGQSWVRKHLIYEDITKKTFGVVVYQEQIMEVIHKVAGLPYTQADKIRKIISKKRDAKEFAPYLKAFIEGCKKMKTFSVKEAEDFWEALQAHARYSFNLSHAVEYAILGYWTAWTKYYYPTEFICASLTYGAISKREKKEELVNEGIRLGLEIVLPKVGVSDPIQWIAKDGKLYVPFIEIKGVGEKTAAKCAEMRQTTTEVVPAQKSKFKNKGFFKPILQTEEKKKEVSKLEQLLEGLGAFGGKPTLPDLESYFSFAIPSSATGLSPILKRIIPGYMGEPGWENLGFEKLPVQALFIQEKTYTPKNSLKRCDDCLLRGECKMPVAPSPGIFNIAIVGEAPGWDEDQSGIGFVGAAGKALWDELIKYGLERKDFHVTNVCHCFPAQSKTPNPQQIKTCSEKWLFNELREIECRLLLAFGNTGLQAFSKDKASGITRLKTHEMTQWNEKIGAWVCYCLHPAALLRQCNLENKTLFADGIKNFVQKIELIQ